MVSPVMYSSASGIWATPQDLFDALDYEFDFTLDVCALPENAKCARYFTPEVDGLKQSWAAETCWMNPPYGREIGEWVEAARNESLMNGTTTVALLPARTDVKWWHRFIWDETKHMPYRQVEIRFVKGRLKFGNAESSAPFPSVVVVFRGNRL